MAEYWLRKTRRANGTGRIEQVEVAPFVPSANGGRGTLGEFDWYTIEAVIKAILDGNTVYTCSPMPGNPTVFNKGAQVHAYLHTDPNAITRDNLSSLPLG